MNASLLSINYGSTLGYWLGETESEAYTDDSSDQAPNSFRSASCEPLSTLLVRGLYRNLIRVHIKVLSGGICGVFTMADVLEGLHDFEGVASRGFIGTV